MEDDQQAGVRERLQAWRQAHPHATFDEIEDAVQVEIVRLHAQLVDEVLGAGPTQDQDAERERPLCATCAVPMRPCGRRARTVVSRMGQPVRVERDYYVCPVCGAGLFPPG